MSDLISRSALMKEFETKTNVYRPNGLWHITGIIAMIEAEPTVDAVAVLRCRDCARWGTGVVGETERVKCCEYAGYIIGENGYCLYGERK